MHIPGVSNQYPAQAAYLASRQRASLPPAMALPSSAWASVARALTPLPVRVRSAA